MPPRLLKSFLCAAAALLAWAILPGTFLDRGLLHLTAHTFANPPFFITGKGDHDSPLILHTLEKQLTTPSVPLPDITITDDPDRVFQTSPPSPVDFAIILKNLRRLGRDSVAIGMPMVWSAPDVISLMALDQQLDALPSLVTSAPLSRGPISAPLPPAFRRASIDISKIHGNARDLPLVNRVSIPDVLLGNSSSLAGFTTLESEPDGGYPHLLARWDDRVILSFPLLAALSDRKVSPSEIGIHLGKYISLGKTGSYIPIDEFGRLTIKPPSSGGSATIPAETLIDAPDNLLSNHRKGTVLIRNGMLAADEASLNFSQTLVPTVSLLAASSGTFTARAFHRIPRLEELLLIASVLSLLHGLGYYEKTNDRRVLAILAGFFVILHFVIAPSTGAWLPTIPALAAIVTSFPFVARRRIVTSNSANPISDPPPEIKPTPVPQPEFQLEIETIKKPVRVPREAPKSPPGKPDKKVEKKAVKKAPAKKSPKKRKGR